MATASEMLTEVETAISALVSGGAKSYTIDGRSLTRNDLGELRAWRTELKREIDLARGPGHIRVKFGETS